MKLTAIAVTWWHSIKDNDFLWDLPSLIPESTHGVTDTSIPFKYSVPRSRERSFSPELHSEIPINLYSLNHTDQFLDRPWVVRFVLSSGSVFWSWSDLISPVRLTIDQQVLKHQRPYWRRHGTDKSRANYKAGYVGLNSADFQKDDLKGAGVPHQLCLLLFRKPILTSPKQFDFTLRDHEHINQPINPQSVLEALIKLHHSGCFSLQAEEHFKGSLLALKYSKTMWYV